MCEESLVRDDHALACGARGRGGQEVTISLYTRPDAPGSLRCMYRPPPPPPALTDVRQGSAVPMRRMVISSSALRICSMRRTPGAP